jgi:hypothetical protein
MHTLRAGNRLCQRRRFCLSALIIVPSEAEFEPNRQRVAIPLFSARDLRYREE